MYYIRCDLDLGIENVAIKIMLCVCSICIDELESDWDGYVPDTN